MLLFNDEPIFTRGLASNFFELGASMVITRERDTRGHNSEQAPALKAVSVPPVSTYAAGREPSLGYSFQS
jgi:hypothetical protein